ncbi:MAG: leucyl/phenylalanyl-tRNA--protein transferase [Phycisphaerales bacterium]|nr:MAG: leucyl/phenylalanyl-tRNA--protein transferase [Phycisphaerales bacterium]
MELTPSILLSAYCQGCFPMAEADGTIYWYDPDPRTIIPLDRFHISRSLKRRLRKGDFAVRYDTVFAQVMARCAERAPGREETWISAEFIEAYTRLHELGFAHSVETWMDDELVGGVYGVSIAGLFAGESMFSRKTDASKIALVHLVARLNERGYRLFDVQFTTAHLQRFGAVEIPRVEYQRRLADALTSDAVSCAPW